MISPLSSRRFVIGAAVVLTAVVFVCRLFVIQVVDDTYIGLADDNSRRFVTIYPSRGLILDRKGREIVTNAASYDLMVTPRQTRGGFDTTVLCSILQIDTLQVEERMTAAKRYSWYKASAFYKQMSSEMYAVLQEQMHKLPGFYVQARTVRQYTRPIAPHLLGYVSEVNQSTIDSNPYYKMGDYIGVSGLEKAYEERLRGKKGNKIFLVDVHNVIKGPFEQGRFDSIAYPGENLTCTIDMELQEYGETLMQRMRGSIVAIEPATGEILAMVSVPMYDPNMLVGKARSQNYQKLQEDARKPLLNRATNAIYPPGSTFKPLQALVCLQEGGITEFTPFPCSGPSSVPIKCTHHHGSPVTLLNAIEQSCNPYFWHAFRSTLERSGSFKDNYNTWREDVLSFGYGTRLETDIPGILMGNIPTEAFFDRIYGPTGWRAMTIRSLSIGQGEISATPLQMANLAAIIANRGFYYPPHIVRTEEYNHRIESHVRAAHFNTVVEGLYRVTTAGTGRHYPVAGGSITWCGKTGTAQNAGNDHALFIAFAPKDNPQIAISVVVENAGFGATWAVPIASLMIEKYLTGNISNPALERKMIEFK